MQNTADMSGSQSLMQVHRQREKERERRQNREREKESGVTSPIPVGAEHTICVRAFVTEETLKKVKFSKQRKMHDWQKKMRVEDQDEAGMSSEFGEE